MIKSTSFVEFFVSCWLLTASIHLSELHRQNLKAGVEVRPDGLLLLDISKCFFFFFFFYRVKMGKHLCTWQQSTVDFQDLKPSFRMVKKKKKWEGVDLSSFPNFIYFPPLYWQQHTKSFFHIHCLEVVGLMVESGMSAYKIWKVVLKSFLFFRIWKELICFLWPKLQNTCSILADMLLSILLIVNTKFKTVITEQLLILLKLLSVLFF